MKKQDTDKKRQKCSFSPCEGVVEFLASDDYEDRFLCTEHLVDGVIRLDIDHNKDPTANYTVEVTLLNSKF